MNDIWKKMPDDNWNLAPRVPHHKANPDWECKFTCDAELFGDPTYIEAVNSFNDFVRQFYSNFIGRGNSFPWFRGQANKDWMVLPAMLREDAIQTAYSQPIQYGRDSLSQKLIKEERYMMKRFVQESAIMDVEDRNALRVYMLAQHYGMPTRLLDWSDSPLVALWMALTRDADDSDGIIIALNPNHKQTETIDRNFLFWRPDKIETLCEYLIGGDFSNRSDEVSDMLEHEAILPLYPPLFQDRLARQRAHFTLHTPASPQAELPSTAALSRWYLYDEYIIKREFKPFFRAYLMSMGIQRWHIMPDLANLAQGIREANFVSRK